MSDLWVRAGVEGQGQFSTLDRAMENATPGTTIRLMPGRLELGVPLKPGVTISGLGSGTMIVDKLSQLEEAPLKFVSIIRTDGSKKEFSPGHDPKIDEMVAQKAREQEQIEKIRKIMGTEDKYPSWVKSYKFKFGKYKGENAAKVIEEDPKYLKWMYENVDGMDLKLREIINEYSDKIGV